MGPTNVDFVKIVGEKNKKTFKEFHTGKICPNRVSFGFNDKLFLPTVLGRIFRVYSSLQYTGTDNPEQ